MKQVSLYGSRQFGYTLWEVNGGQLFDHCGTLRFATRQDAEAYCIIHHYHLTN